RAVNETFWFHFAKRLKYASRPEITSKEGVKPAFRARLASFSRKGTSQNTARRMSTAPRWRPAGPLECAWPGRALRAESGQAGGQFLRTGRGPSCIRMPTESCIAPLETAWRPDSAAAANNLH